MNPVEFISIKSPTIKGINFAKNNYTVLFFYPRDNTPGCTIEAKEFSELLPHFKKLNTKVYGMSKDSEESHKDFIEKQDLKVELLSDESLKFHQRFKVWREKKFMGKRFMGTARTTFLINSTGRVEEVWERVKPKGHAKQVLKKVSELMNRPISKKVFE